MVSNDLTLLANVMVRGQLAEHYNVPVEYLTSLSSLTVEDVNRMGPKIRREFDELCRIARRFEQET